MHMIRKGQIRWLKKGDVAGQIQFVNRAFGLAEDFHRSALTRTCRCVLRHYQPGGNYSQGASATRTTVIVSRLVGPGHIEITVTARK